MTPRISIVVALVLGLAMGCIAMYAGWQHNPQGEFHSEDGVDWVWLLAIGLSWAVPVAFLSMVVIESLRFVVESIRDRVRPPE
jgi:hypothetical protein